MSICETYKTAFIYIHTHREFYSINFSKISLMNNTDQQTYIHKWCIHTYKHSWKLVYLFRNLYSMIQLMSHISTKASKVTYIALFPLVAFDRVETSHFHVSEDGHFHTVRISQRKQHSSMFVTFKTDTLQFLKLIQIVSLDFFKTHFSSNCDL